MSGAGRYDFHGDINSNSSNFAGRDLYYYQLVRERNSLLHDIAVTKTRASVLVVVGFLMVAGGATVFAFPILEGMNNVGSIEPSDFSFGGPRVGGISLGVIGFAVGFIGQFVLVAGIVLHIVAAARRRRVGELPPMPSTVNPPPAGHRDPPVQPRGAYRPPPPPRHR
jgi:hypothetical protein